MTPHVLIIGGGIGGLCLAQGLRRSGIRVTVFERSQTRDDWLQGYRIHINPNGSTALRNCLEPENWQAFLDSVSVEGGGFGFVTEQLKPLLSFDSEMINPSSSDPASRHYGVSRILLRQVLLAGMDEVVELGKTFERYELLPDGRVRAHFADGTSATGDLLIGADGANSRLRGQLLPHADRVDTGVLAIAGKYQLTESSRRQIPEELTTQANMVMPIRRGFLFTAVWSGDRDSADASDYTFWAYADSAGQFPAVDGLDGTQLRDVVGAKISGWSPELLHLVAQSDPATVNLVRVRSAAQVKPWPTGPVTLLGDAIHSMTPMAGVGANTALRDADLLRRQLIEVHSGRLDLTQAVHEYERQMLDYGFAAVRRSLRNAKQAGSANRFGRAIFRVVLRLIAAIPAMKRRMAASMGA